MNITEQYIYTTTCEHVKEKGITGNHIFTVEIADSVATTKATIDGQLFIGRIPLPKGLPPVEDHTIMVWDQNAIDEFAQTVTLLQDAGFTHDEICLYLNMNLAVHKNEN